MPERDAHQHGVHARTTAIAIGGIGCTIALVCAVVYGLVWLWDTPPAGANAQMDVHIPGPNLRSAPQQDSARYAAAQADVLERYEWIERANGIARIPIEEAMRILAKEPPRAATPQASVPEVVQRVGAQLPLEARFRDEEGHESALSRFLGERPALVVFGYYRCPNLCTTLMESVLVSASAMKLDPAQYRIVSIDIDPRETADDAARKAQAYGAAYEGVPLHLLTGAASESARVATTAGVSYAYDKSIDQYSHPLAVLVVSPTGRISRYFAGVQIEPDELRLALVEASNGRIGTLTDRVFLRCAHFDPKTGRYSLAAMSFVRGGSLLVVGGLGWWVWRRRKR